VIETSADVKALADRWKNALVSGWNPPNSVSSVDSTAVLAQYAPDYLASFKTKPNSGLGLGSQLLATLSPTPLTTDDLRADYFQDFLATGPTPFFNKTMIYRKLSKVRGCVVPSSIQDTLALPKRLYFGDENLIITCIHTPPHLPGCGDGRRPLGLHLHQSREY
jgi:hypothetical protein